MPEIKVKGIHKVSKPLASGKCIEYHRIGRGKDALTFWHSEMGIEEGSDEYLQALTQAKEEARPSNNLFRGVIIDYLGSRDLRRWLSARNAISDMKPMPKMALKRDLGMRPLRPSKITGFARLHSNGAMNLSQIVWLMRAWVRWRRS